MMETNAAISFDGVGKRFDDTWVLRDIDLDVPPGTIIGMIGPSGSGKTTTVRLANGYYRADEGEVRLLGTDPATMPTAQRRSIGYLPQHPVLFDELSLWENLNFHASMNGVAFSRRRRLRELLELVELDGQEKKLVSESSGGMRRRLALAATLVHAPRVLMLDEPTAGIDPILRRRFWDHFRQLRDDGTTLVITTQYVTEAAHCDVVAMLAHGQTAAVGSPAELRRQAYGGLELDVRFEQPVDDSVVGLLLAIDGVKRAEPSDVDVVRVAIDPDVLEASDIAPRLGDEFTVAGTAEVATDWDDVFIELVGADASDDVEGDAVTADAVGVAP
ncbi:MAG: ABC transporter ATP-binding protein [Ilumatobacter sp.]|nr:ABC transporter ATP-binding protein [Ilumatobacter sp.]